MTTFYFLATKETQLLSLKIQHHQEQLQFNLINMSYFLIVLGAFWLALHLPVIWWGHQEFPLQETSSSQIPPVVLGALIHTHLLSSKIYRLLRCTDFSMHCTPEFPSKTPPVIWIYPSVHIFNVGSFCLSKSSVVCCTYAIFSGP